jgi:hypothetical protein
MGKKRPATELTPAFKLTFSAVFVLTEATDGMSGT